eukprot:2554679-Alexandrium_andersonii.AAC.1
MAADPRNEHALCCARGPSTVGHNDVRDLVHGLAKPADPAAEVEASGLLRAAPGKRPADVLTSAASDGALTAWDVGTASPDAALTGADCLEPMRRRKVAAHAQFTD